MYNSASVDPSLLCRNVTSPFRVEPNVEKVSTNDWTVVAMTLPMNTEIATTISENVGGVVAYCVCCSGVYEEGSREGA